MPKRAKERAEVNELSEVKVGRGIEQANQTVVALFCTTAVRFALYPKLAKFFGMGDEISLKLASLFGVMWHSSNFSHDFSYHIIHFLLLKKCST